MGDGSRQGHLGSPWKWSEKANKKEPEGLKRGLEVYGEWWESGKGLGLVAKVGWEFGGGAVKAHKKNHFEET